VHNYSTLLVEQEPISQVSSLKQRNFSYSPSVEQALKELLSNAWDVLANSVQIADSQATMVADQFAAGRM
jgi:hypothetical protein